MFELTIDKRGRGKIGVIHNLIIKRLGLK